MYFGFATTAFLSSPVGANIKPPLSRFRKPKFEAENSCKIIYTIERFIRTRCIEFGLMRKRE